jgi:hypothetical protein
MILSQKILQQLIMEEITKYDACCLARFSPKFYIDVQDRGKFPRYGDKKGRQSFIKYLAAEWFSRAQKSDQDWDSYRDQHIKMLDKYNIDLEGADALQALESCRSGRGLIGQDEVNACAGSMEPPSKEDIKSIEYGTRTQYDPTTGEEVPYDEVPWTTEGPWAPEEEIEYDEPEPPVRRTRGRQAAQRMRQRRGLEETANTIELMIREELTKTDKAEIKKMISTEMDKTLKSELKKILQDELIKELGSKKTKEEMGEIAKKVIKKLYKDLSFHHPYIIDRIKV